MRNGKILKELENYIAEHLQKEKTNLYYEQISYSPVHDSTEELENYMAVRRKKSFVEVLFKFIDTKGLQDVDVYKKAGIDRRHFSKIRSNPDYKVSKQTGIMFAFALELNEEETDELLSTAGFSLSNYDTFDLIIQFFLEKELYDLDEVNEALDYFKLKPLFR